MFGKLRLRPLQLPTVPGPQWRAGNTGPGGGAEGERRLTVVCPFGCSEQPGNGEKRSGHLPRGASSMLGTLPAPSGPCRRRLRGVQLSSEALCSVHCLFVWGFGGGCVKGADQAPDTWAACLKLIPSPDAPPGTAREG